LPLMDFHLTTLKSHRMRVRLSFLGLFSAAKRIGRRNIFLTSFRPLAHSEWTCNAIEYISQITQNQLRLKHAVSRIPQLPMQPNQPNLRYIGFLYRRANIMDKASLFIASSVEGLSVAEAINLNLDHDAHTTLWRTGTFQLGSVALDDLVKKSSTVDFAVFVFTPDDVSTIRKQEAVIARDNVVFELGLFIGALGKDRCYVVRPRGVEMHLPSDLLGLTTADYEANRPDNDIASALNAACKLIKDRIRELGAIARSPLSKAGSPARHAANPPDYKLLDADLLFLAQCVKSHVANPSGLPFWSIENVLKGESEHALLMSAIKLLRLGYVEKTIETGYEDDSEYYAYRATDNGLDVFLKHENRYVEFRKTSSTLQSMRSYAATKKTTSGFDDMDDKIPF
jgi:predicted nucleotide-binding protein